MKLCTECGRIGPKKIGCTGGCFNVNRTPPQDWCTSPLADFANRPVYNPEVTGRMKIFNTNQGMIAVITDPTCFTTALARSAYL